MNKLIVLTLRALILVACVIAVSADYSKDSMEFEMAWKYNWNTTTTTMGNVTTPPPDIWDTWYEDVTRMRALVDENHALVKENQDLLKQIGALVVENQREIGIIRNETQNENKTLGSLEAEIKGLKKDEAKLKKTIKNLTFELKEQEQVIKVLRTNLTAEITGLKLNDSMQGETILSINKKLNMQGKDIKDLISDDVKLNERVKKLKNENTKQGKNIKNLNEKVDELAKKECQIGIKKSHTKGMKGYFSRNERDVQKIPTTYDVTFHKSFSDTPEILLSPTIVIFEDTGIQGWLVELGTVNRTGFTFLVSGWGEKVEVDFFAVNYMACVS